MFYSRSALIRQTCMWNICETSLVERSCKKFARPRSPVAGRPRSCTSTRTHAVRSDAVHTLSGSGRQQRRLQSEKCYLPKPTERLSADRSWKPATSKNSCAAFFVNRYTVVRERVIVCLTRLMLDSRRQRT